MYILRLVHVYTREESKTNNQPMNQYSGTRKKSPRRPHAEDGTFTPDYAGETKRLRSMRLTDTAWDLLAEIAEKNHITRTEVIELFARGEDLY
jgi:hypothetical protein